MRIISLVPSITETLVLCGVELVGRSRFCIHPDPEIQQIPKVGGTKDVDWEKAGEVQPDLIILDREENTLEMAKQCPFPYFVVHITSLEDVAHELGRLAEHIENDALTKLAKRWQLAAQPRATSHSIMQLPGVIEWWVPPRSMPTRLVYLIWKEPWMSIGPNTFIHSMLCHLGIGEYLYDYSEKYPVIDITSLDPKQTLLLFSTEPFPFHRYRDELAAMGFSCGLIDGEKFSWYGVRSLEFLEQMAH